MGHASSSEESIQPTDGVNTVVAPDELFYLINHGDKTTAFMFERQLRQTIQAAYNNNYNKAVSVVCSVTREGQTLLHCAVLNGRTDLLAAFFRTGCWSGLYHKKIQMKTARYNGLTAVEIAQQRNQKNCLLELQRLEDWEHTLNHFHRIARKGKAAAMKALLHGNKYELSTARKLDDTDAMGCTALYWACVSGNLEMVEMLMVYGMDPQAVNKQNETLLHVACQLGHYQLITLLYKSFKMSLTMKDSNGLTPAAQIICNNDDQSFRQLLRCDVPPDELCNVILMSAALGITNFIEFLVTVLNVDPRITNSVGLNALSCAAFNGQLDVVRYLLGLESIDVRAVGLRCRNVLHTAARSASPNSSRILHMTLRVIKRRNADDWRAIINSRDSYFGFDLCRLVPPDVESMVRIVEVHRGLVCVFDRRIMHVEGELGNEDGKQEEKIDDLGRFGKVHCFPGNDESAAWKSLREKFQLEIRDNPQPDMTPLHIAVYQTPVRLEAVETLLRHGADPNIQDALGLSPLHLAAMRGFVQVVASLVRHGAVLTTRDKRRKTALDVARENKHAVVVQFLTDVRDMTVNEALDRPDVKLNELPFKCPVCLNDIKRHQGVIPRLCRHFICRRCLSGHIKSQTTVTAELSCPAMSCRAVLLHREIRKIVTRAEYDKLVERSLQVCELSAGNSARHCKTINCNYWVLLDTVSGSCRCQQFQCQVCHKVNCVDCDAIHEGSTCSQFQEWQREWLNSEAKNVSEINRMVEQRQAMHCPKCRHAITKNGGCNNMTCRCGQRFIWTGIPA